MRKVIVAKNVVIIGGGQKSGRMIADRFRDNGDTVRVLSHRVYPDSTTADFTSTADVLTKFRELTQDLATIDVFFYNTNHHAGPTTESDFKKNSDSCSPQQIQDRYKVIEDDWHKNAHIGMVLPNLLTVAALEKMTSSSVGVYITTYISYGDLNLTNPYTHLLSYKGVKAVQNHMMLAFAAHNDAGATFFSVAPHYPYEDPTLLEVVIDNVYRAVQTASPEDNGKFIQCF
jgi:NAD(P)-dependent dehydrogenase (short-subunit alcohol dehydrogenase family)